MPPETSSEPTQDTAQIANKIAALLRAEHFSTGSRAALRRMAPADLAEPALQRMLADYVPDHWLENSGMADWGLIVHALALASPDRLTEARPLGAALQQAEYSESRLARLLQANRAQLNDLIPRACRFLAAKGEALHAADLAYFVRAISSLKPEQTAMARTKIARDFYRAARKTDALSSQTQD